MKPRTQAIILVAAMAGLVTGCATQPKHQCKQCVDKHASDKGSCSSKSGCGANGCGANGCNSGGKKKSS